MFRGPRLPPGHCPRRLCVTPRVAIKRPECEGIVLYLGSSQSVWGARTVLQPPSMSRAEAGQRWALGGLQGREGPLTSWTHRKTAWTGGLHRSPPPSLPPRVSLASFGHCTLQGCAQEGSGCIREGRAAGSPPGIGECRCICPWDPHPHHFPSHSFLPCTSPCPSRPGGQTATPGMGTARMYRCEGPPAAPDTLGAGG